MKRVVVAVALLAGVTAAASSALAAQEASKADPGIGSAAALSAPSCDRERERLKFQSTGAPPCVKPWANGDDNGGATAQGVTKDSIAVVVLWADLPAARAAEGNIVNQATGEPGTEPDAIVDTNEVYKPFHETWGREIEYTFVKAGGLDEASQRADAVKVAAMKPFAVLDYATLYVGGGGLVFESALEGKIPVVFTFPCCGVIPAVERSNPLVANAGEWVGKALVGRKAKWAGDDTLQAEERVFGVVHPAGNFAIDLAVFTEELQKRGGKVTTAVSYPSGTEQLNSPPPEALEQVPTIISRLKSEGVTTVVNFASGLGMSPALTKAATDQDYFPEWVVTGNGYQDIDIVARQSDQQQLAHAFGLLWFNPYVDIQEGGAAAVSAFHWFWGTDKGTFSAGASSLVTSLYTGVHLAGPKLTASRSSAPSSTATHRPAARSPTRSRRSSRAGPSSAPCRPAGARSGGGAPTRSDRRRSSVPRRPARGSGCSSTVASATSAACSRRASRSSSTSRCRSRCSTRSRRPSDCPSIPATTARAPAGDRPPPRTRRRESLITAPTKRGTAMPTFDMVIKGGTVIDGVRTPRYKADVGIKDGRIATIGSVEASDGAEVVDASGRIVAPGFVDVHTHYDSQLFWDPWCTMSGWHGVTSVVIGNCGFGFAPCRPEDQDRAMLSVSRNEAVPLETMRAGMPWDWVTFPEYLDSAERTPKGVNVLSLVPLAPLYGYVIGVDKAKEQRATDDELDAMCALLVEAMEAGGCGWSSQISGDVGNVQRDYDGTPMVTDCMTEREIVAFSRALRRIGRGTTQITGKLDTAALIARRAAARSSGTRSRPPGR